MKPADNSSDFYYQWATENLIGDKPFKKFGSHVTVTDNMVASNLDAKHVTFKEIRILIISNSARIWKNNFLGLIIKLVQSPLTFQSEILKIPAAGYDFREAVLQLRH